MHTKPRSRRHPRVLVIPALLVIVIVLASCSTTVDPYSVARETPSPGSYPVVGTGQLRYWGADGKESVAPAKDEVLYGQDARHPGTPPSYRDNGNGTVSDLVTGLMWTKSIDLNGDWTITRSDKRTCVQAASGASVSRIGGYDDWRLPTIKELYSLIDFNGTDPAVEAKDTSGLKPYIDTTYFDFSYGLSTGERIIDSQFATTTLYVDRSSETKMFGVNFADGRIKGYGLGNLGSKLFFVRFVRGNLAYGVNDFLDNRDGTITDSATTLMWSQEDSGEGMDWGKALAWVQAKNAENYCGHSDWRLPSIKEIQSLVDYSRSPGTSGSPAIDPLFLSSKITNEAGDLDYPCYWSSTTHIATRGDPGLRAAYIAFGQALGKINGVWVDVHGAGAQRSDPKLGNAADYPDGFGPQGDAIRIDNFVRLVRDAK